MLRSDAMALPPDAGGGNRTASAHPATLRDFVSTGHDIRNALAPKIVELEAALNAFRSTTGWEDYLSDVPPLDIDMGVVRGRIDQLRMFVFDVATAFEDADGAHVDSNGVVHATNAAIDAEVDVELGEVTELVWDGDRWIFPGTDGNDYVRVVERDGRTYLEVGVGEYIDGEWRVRWESRELNDEQAANLVIRTGAGNDVIAVSPDIDVRITVWSGADHDQVGMGGENFESRLGGSGDDRIFTGSGDDQVFAGAGSDEVYTGDGNDFADGQGHDDRIVSGVGDDRVYGGSGDDTIHGGHDVDFVEGGTGEDTLDGGGGDDILSGGRDADVLAGNDGNDQLFGGRGEDEVRGGTGDDQATSETQDLVLGVENHVTIELQGAPGSVAIDLGDKPGWMTDAEWDAWVERIDSDLELLRTTETGRAGLEALDEASRDSDSTFSPFDDDTHIRIVPYAPNSGGNLIGLGDVPEPVSFDDYISTLIHNENNPNDQIDVFDGTAAYAMDEWVAYRPELAAGDNSGPPATVLYHELSHSWDNMHGGFMDIENRTYSERVYDSSGNLIEERDVPRPELNSVGFDIDGDGDIDTVGAGDRTDHPAVLTENALRIELGLPRRISYLDHIYENDPAGRRVEYGDTGD